MHMLVSNQHIYLRYVLHSSATCSVGIPLSFLFDHLLQSSFPYLTMHLQYLVFAALSAVTASATQGLDLRIHGVGHKYLWGADRMGKLVKRTSTTTTSTTSARKADPTCTPGPHNRACWYNGYSVATDFDKKSPTTGKTVSYHLEITNTTCNPDGNGPQQCMLINNQYPGPTIQADWGDTLSITVKNSMQTNGTGIHFHGVRQLNSCGSDGVGGITECPIAPGNTATYTFKCTQFGSSWYHSHHSSQYGMGVVGTIIINGPSTANYDVDLGTFTVNDWYYQDAWVANSQSMQNLQQQKGPPTADNILVNGTGKSSSASGQYAQVQLQPGQVHKLRLVNPSVDNFIRVSLDGHPFTVIATDFIPVRPLANQNWILFGPGQRYDVVFTANATAGSYWFRAEVATDCLSGNSGHGRGLFTYANATVSAPVDTNTTAPTNGCAELVTAPFWPQSVDSTTFNQQVQDLTVDLTATTLATNNQNLVYWTLNMSAMAIDWKAPTLQYVMENNGSFPGHYDVIEIPNEGIVSHHFSRREKILKCRQWTYWIMQTLQSTVSPTEIAAPPPPHPIHLHGHDFFVLGSGSGEYSSNATLNFEDPTRRDTTTLPSSGWLAIAFLANNPGAWLMHCHIAWHISEGLGVQFLEAKNQIVMPDQTAFNTQCANWQQFASSAPYPQDDSGL